MNLTAAKFVREFKVVAISSNRGSFGHNQMVLVARDGTAFRVQHIQGGGHEVWTQGQIITLPYENGNYVWGAKGIECPEEMPKAPLEVIRQVWN